MIEFNTLPDDHDDLAQSPLCRATLLTLGYAKEHGGIGLTATSAFKRDFVRWSIARFDWPGRPAEDVLRYRQMVNEADFPPLEVVHFLLLRRKLGRHHKGAFCITKAGRELSERPGALFATLIPFFLFRLDHAAYSRSGDIAAGDWATWFNVMNPLIEDGIAERDLFGHFYGPGPDWHNDGWREIAAFSTCVLMPLEWAGLIVSHEVVEPDGRRGHVIFKTPLWRSALTLETDHALKPAVRH